MHYLLFYDFVDGFATLRAPFRSVHLVHPYVTNGLVTKWSAWEWTTVVGPGAAAPLVVR